MSNTTNLDEEHEQLGADDGYDQRSWEERSREEDELQDSGMSAADAEREASGGGTSQERYADAVQADEEYDLSDDKDDTDPEREAGGGTTNQERYAAAVEHDEAERDTYHYGEHDELDDEED